MCSLALVRQLVKEKENSELKPVKLRLKIDLMSYPARAEVLVNMIPPCFTLSNIRYVSRVKRSNPGKGVAPSPTPW